MKRKYQIVYGAGILLVLAAGGALYLLELLPVESVVMFLLGLALSWHGVASMVPQMRQVLGEKHTLSFQRVYGAVFLFLGCAWVSLSMLPKDSVAAGMFFTLAMALGAVFAVWMLEQKQKGQT